MNYKGNNDRAKIKSGKKVGGGQNELPGIRRTGRSVKKDI